MRKIVSLSIIALMAMPFSALAETVENIPAPMPIEEANSVDPMVPPVDLNAAPNGTATLAPTNRSLGSGLWEFRSVSCTTNPAFATNSCDQCFDGGSVKVGETITGLFDNWLNNTTTIQVAYREEQKYPNMVRFGNTTWTQNPPDETKFWKYPSDIVWVQAGSGWKNQYILPAGQSVKFMEADIGAGFKLERTDKRNGEVAGMLRFPLVSHSIDASANESIANTTYECATFSVASSPTPVTPEKPTPQEITTTKTGPETLLLIVAAFFIAFGLMFSLRKNV
jgi:hypothetical protein